MAQWRDVTSGPPPLPLFSLAPLDDIRIGNDRLLSEAWPGSSRSSPGTTATTFLHTPQPEQAHDLSTVCGRLACQNTQDSLTSGPLG